MPIQKPSLTSTVPDNYYESERENAHGGESPYRAKRYFQFHFVVNRKSVRIVWKKYSLLRERETKTSFGILQRLLTRNFLKRYYLTSTLYFRLICVHSKIFDDLPLRDFWSNFLQSPINFSESNIFCFHSGHYLMLSKICLSISFFYKSPHANLCVTALNFFTSFFLYNMQKL